MARSPKKPPHGYSENGKPIWHIHEGINVCGANTKNGPCRCRAVLDNGRCRVHGGNMKPGPLHPRYQTGKYSWNAPEKLSTEINRHLNVPNITSNVTELALLDARIGELLSTLENGGYADQWRRLKAAVDHFQSKIFDPFKDIEGSLEDCQKAYNALIKIIEQGNNNSATHKEIRENISLRSTVAKTELDVQRLHRNYMPLDVVISLFTDISTIIANNVPEPHIRAEISKQIDGLSTRPKYRPLLGAQGSVDTTARTADVLREDIITAEVTDADFDIDIDSLEDAEE